MVQYGSVRKSPIPIRQKKAWQKGLPMALLLSGIIALITLLVIVSISTYIGWKLTHPEKKELDDLPSNYNLNYKDIEVGSRLDQTRLSAWQIETENDPKGVIIFSHGYGMNRLQEELPALALANDLVERSYHVLLFDYRNSGKSDGSLTTIGYLEQEDLLSFVDYAKDTYPDLPIGVIGFSMGASTAMIAAQKETAIQAVVADSPFAHLREYLEDNLSHWSNLPNFPFTRVMMTVIPVMTGIDADQVSPRDAIRNMETPHLLIHGDADKAIPYQQSEQIVKQSKKGNASLWIAPDVGHVQAYATFPSEYKERVIQFFDQSLQGK